jgi:hypothetical protein
MRNFSRERGEKIRECDPFLFLKWRFIDIFPELFLEQVGRMDNPWRSIGSPWV